MANNSNFILVGATSIVSSAPLGTTAPTGMGSLSSPWVDLGTMSDSGLTEALAVNEKTFTPNGAVSPVATIITSREVSFQATFWESNIHVLSLWTGIPESGLTPDGTTHVISWTEQTRPTPDPRALVIDSIVGTNHERIYIPKAQVSNVGNRVHKSDEIKGYDLTITALAASDGTTIHRQLLLDAIVAG